MALKTLSKTNITNGNIVQASDVSQSIDAFTSTEGYAISVSGSFTFTGDTTGSGYFSNAMASDQVKPQGVATNKGYTLPYLASTGSLSAVYYSSTGPTYNPTTETLKATNFEGTASLASTASYASINQVNGYFISSGSIVASAGTLKFFAGASKTGAIPPYTAIVTVSPVDLTGKTLNQTLFLGTTPSQSGATVSATLNSPTSITFVSNLANTDFTFIATYI